MAGRWSRPLKKEWGVQASFQGAIWAGELYISVGGWLALKHRCDIRKLSQLVT